MDFLDSSLHASILSSLAANLASSSEQDDLALLTSQFSSLAPVTNGAINGVLARLVDSDGAASTQSITAQQADGIIAFAEYAAVSAPALANLERVLAMLPGVPTWEIEASLGMHGAQDWATSDLVTHALVNAALAITAGGVGERAATLREVAAFQESLVEAIATAPGPRVISHLLPALNGARRAVVNAPFGWTSADLIPVHAKLVPGAFAHVNDAATQKSDLSTSEGRLVQATLLRYGTSLKGLSAGLVQLASLECQEAYLSAVLRVDASESSEANWRALLLQEVFAVAPSKNLQSIQTCLHTALECWAQTLAVLEGEEDAVADEYSFDILLKSLRVASLASMASGAPSSRVVAILERLVSDTSPVIDESVQLGAVECLHVLVRAFPGTASTSALILRSFILSPCPIFEVTGELSASPALRAAASAFAACTRFANDGNTASSVIQSLVSHLIVSDREGTIRASQNASIDARSIRSGGARSDSQQRLISANVAHAVAIIALEVDQAAITELATTMLLQKLQGTDAVIDGAIMLELAHLAVGAHQTGFTAIVKAISDVSKRAGSHQGLEKSVLTAQTHLATVATKRPDFLKVFLVEIMTLFVDRAVQENDSSSRAEIASGLLDLVPVIDVCLATGSFAVHKSMDAELVTLFRSMWYLCILSGFLSGPSRIADWQRAALMRIAEHTPCLLQGAGDDFVETDLRFNPILGRTNYTVSPDAVRTELAALLPSQAGTIRALPTPQAVFLLTAVKLESLRAEAGRPSTMLSYFHNEGINAGPLFPVLTSIADKVNATFVTCFSELVTRHAINLSIYPEVREILLQCAHPYARVRSVSIRYLNDLITSFPSLLCEASVVNVLLELLTVLRRACQAEFTDEYTPTYVFHSSRSNFSLTLPDDYTLRNSILSELHNYARTWLKASITRAPFEMQGLLQDYIDSAAPAAGLHASSTSEDEMGKSVAIDMVRVLPSNGKEAALPPWGGWKSDNSAHFASTYATRNFYGGGASHSGNGASTLVDELESLAADIRDHKMHHSLPTLRALFYRCGGELVQTLAPNLEILHQMVALPVQIFSEGSVALGQEVWTWVVDARPDLESRLMAEVSEAWTFTMQQKRGLFSSALDRENPLDQETRFTPTNKEAMTQDYALATHLLRPHTILLSFLSSRFQAFRYRDRDLVLAAMRLIMRSCLAAESWSTHQLARELRMRLVSFGFVILQGSQAEAAVEFNFRTTLYDAALSWFGIRAGWSYGSNRMQVKTDLQAMAEVQAAVSDDSPVYDLYATSIKDQNKVVLPGGVALAVAMTQHANRRDLLLTLLDNEVDRLRLWLNPLMDPAKGDAPSARALAEGRLRQIARIAWSLSTAVAVHLPERFKVPALTTEVTRLVRSDPERAAHIPEALAFFIGDAIANDVRPQLRHLIFWAPVPVISALRFLFPKFGSDPILLQYALRVLEHHPVEVTFFYIPQVVQALRTDEQGYAERFIFETSKISQLFCHQIIWNMKANAYRGDAGEEADPMKPTLDRMVEMIVQSLSGTAKDFYLREFAFFDEVTSISAKLKPFIKASKLEKKAKIDEEMAKIKVVQGVYLPSNPDGEVVDIDRNSGRPLQSHAKAPFMATFKVRREQKEVVDPEAILDVSTIKSAEHDKHKKPTYDTWQSAIFKVGDDCRQDVLALQIIAMHKNIFTCLGLDLLVTPYRVTATGPGCGVIDVIPNATSRDEMGRAKVNDLKSFFLLKYGSVESVEFQKARINFIQSMAAYSLLCYLIQIKDRHNGNIMIDGEGRIIHIDFGFLFDIGPGGVKFEPSSFKLTHEMVNLMGGKSSVGFKLFCSLVVKSFLACRQYGQAVVDTSSLMLAAEFPSFKGEPTMDRLTERFQLGLTEKEAALYMMGVINNAFENPRSIVYDEFQYLQNAIPYSR